MNAQKARKAQMQKRRKANPFQRAGGGGGGSWKGRTQQAGAEPFQRRKQQQQQGDPPAQDTRRAEKIAEIQGIALGKIREYNATTDDATKKRLAQALAQLKRKHANILGADILGQIDAILAAMQDVVNRDTGRGGNRGGSDGEMDERWWENPLPEDFDGTRGDIEDPLLQQILDRMEQLENISQMPKGKAKKAAKQLWKNVKIYMGDVYRARGHANQKVLEEGAQGSFGHSRQVGPDAYGGFGGSSLMSPSIGPQEFSPFSTTGGYPIGFDPMLDPALLDPYSYGSSFGFDPGPPMPFPPGFAPDLDWSLFGGSSTGVYMPLDPGPPFGYSPLPDSAYSVPEYAPMPDLPLPAPPSQYVEYGPPPMGPFDTGGSTWSWMDGVNTSLDPLSSAEAGLWTFTPTADPSMLTIDYSGTSIDSAPGLDDVEMGLAGELIGEQLGDLSAFIDQRLSPALDRLKDDARRRRDPELAARARGAEYAMRVARESTTRGLADYSPIADEGLSGLGDLAGKVLGALGGGPVLVGTIGATFAAGLLVDWLRDSKTAIVPGLGNGLRLGVALALPLMLGAWAAKKVGLLR